MLRRSLTPVFSSNPKGRNLKALKIILMNTKESGELIKSKAIEEIKDAFDLSEKTAIETLSVLRALGFSYKEKSEDFLKFKKNVLTNPSSRWKEEIIARFKNHLLGFSELMMILEDKFQERIFTIAEIEKIWVSYLPKKEKFKKNHRYQLKSRLAWLIDLGYIERLDTKPASFKLIK